MDPLHFGSKELLQTENVAFTSGKTIFSQLENLVKKNEPIIDVIKGSDDAMKHFEEVFPEIYQSNDVGKIGKETFKLWNESSNNIRVELDVEATAAAVNGNVMEEGRKFDVYIGGPAALTGAALQARSGHNPQNVLYGHDGRRGASNWKGSASYFHIRDAVPVYYWPDNHGAYTLYATAKHFVQRNLNTDKYLQEVSTDPSWNKLRLNWSAFLKEPSIAWLFAKNQYYALQDVGLHKPGTQLRGIEEQTAAATMNHAYLTKEIFSEIRSPKPLLLESEDSRCALYTFMGGEKDVEETQSVVNSLTEIGGEKLLDHQYLSKEEIADRGYNPDVVKRAAVFPKDGNFPPYLDGQMESLITEEGGQVWDNMVLEKILVSPTEDGSDAKVTRVAWKNTVTGEIQTIGVNSLYLSLGPSMKKLEVNLPANYNPAKLGLNSFKNSLGFRTESKDTQYFNFMKPTLMSIAQYISSRVGSGVNMLNKMMLAAGSSMVFMVRVEKAKVADDRLRRFRDYIDGHNKHIIRLGEKDVTIGDKTYTYFVMQTTGGGHFPYRYAHAETALNVFKANVVPMLGLDEEHIDYEVLQVRSCARGVTAQNAFRMSAPASNMVMVYGIGGIGMSVMAGNALLMKAIMSLRQKLSAGTIDNAEFAQKLQTSDFGSNIEHWNKANPFTQNYAQFFDAVKNPKQIAKTFGFKKPEPLATPALGRRSELPNTYLDQPPLPSALPFQARLLARVAPSFYTVQRNLKWLRRMH